LAVKQGGNGCRAAGEIVILFDDARIAHRLPAFNRRLFGQSRTVFRERCCGECKAAEQYQDYPVSHEMLQL